MADLFELSKDWKEEVPEIGRAVLQRIDWAFEQSLYIHA
jgi:hypothetical protein